MNRRKLNHLHEVAVDGFSSCAADALAASGTATSSPSTDGVAAAGVALFAIAFGSNFRAGAAGVASVTGAAGDWGVLTAGDTPDFLSISSKMLFGPPDAAVSRCFRSRSAACFCFHASSLASLSAFFSSSVGAAEGVVGFEAC